MEEMEEIGGDGEEIEETGEDRGDWRRLRRWEEIEEMGGD
jgi:hypothetical protein